MEVAEPPIVRVPLNCALPDEFITISFPICNPFWFIVNRVVFPSFKLKAVDVISTCSVEVGPRVTVVLVNLDDVILLSIREKPVASTSNLVAAPSPKAVIP